VALQVVVLLAAQGNLQQEEVLQVDAQVVVAL